MKLQSKILLLFLSVSLLIGGPVFWTLKKTAEKIDRHELSRHGEMKAKDVAERGQEAFRTGSEAALLPLLQAAQEQTGALYVAVIDPSGRVRAHTNVAEEGRVYSDAATQADLRLTKPQARETRYKAAPAMETAVPVFSRPAAPSMEDFLLGEDNRPDQKTRLGLIRIALPLDAVIRRERELFLQLAAILLAGGALGVVLVFVFVRRLLRPIGWLSSATSRIARGDFGVSMPVGSKDELGSLAEHFNRMSQVLAETTVSKKSLQESQNELMEAQRLAHVGSYLSTPDLGRITWSDEVYRIFGRDPKLPLPEKEELKVLFTPESWAKFLEYRNEALQTGKSYRIDLEIVRPDSTTRWITLRGEPARNPGGGTIGIRGTVQDITDMKLTQDLIEQREQYFRSLIENTSDIITVLDANSAIQYESPSVTAMLGYSPAELIGTPAIGLVHPEDQENVAQILQKCSQSPGIPQFCAYRFKHKDGSWRTLESYGTLIPGQRAERLLVVNSRDVTERNKVQNELFQSRQLLQSVVDNIPQRVFWKDRDLKFLGCNNILARDAGLEDPRQIMGKSDFDLAWKETAELYRADDRKVMESEISKLHFQEPQNRPDGSILWLETSKLPLRDQEGHVIGILGTYEDISERKRAEESLRLSESRVRLLLDSAAEGIYGEDLEGNCTFVNQACARMLGYRHVADIYGKNMHRLLHHTHPDGRPYEPEDCPIMRTFREGAKMHVDNDVFWHADGTSFPAEYWSYPIMQDGKVAGAVISFLDITQRRQSTQLHAMLFAAIEQSKDSVVITDPGGKIHYVNRAFELSSGYSREEVIGQTPRILKSGKHDQTFYKTMWAALKSGRVWQSTITNRRKDGTLFEEEGNISPVMDEAGEISNYVAVKRDISERRRMEEILRQSEKMSAVGQLAAGVAHEINNPLGVILGFAQASVRRLQSDDPLEVPLKSIEREALRCKDLVQNLLTFSRVSKLDREPVDINRTVASALSLISAQTKIARIEVRKELAPDLPLVLGQMNQLQQVIINLANNAMDAMGDLGCLTIKTEVVKDGPLTWVCLRMIDTGPGIPPEVLPRIFEPFYTTKPVGKGTGLGLSLIHEIVTKHSGSIDVKSVPGRTEFRIQFPVRIASGNAAEGVRT